MFLGIDLGTSAVKAILADDREQMVGSAAVALTVQRPRPGWSEQNPQDWWTATLEAVDTLASRYPVQVSAVAGIGLSGQMHGAVLLDRGAKVLRPCILWNDSRAGEECGLLERALPNLGATAGNRAMAGFTAPKVLWVRRNEPDIFARTATVLLPKAWLRLELTGEAIEDESDASGTLWLDVGARTWSEAALAATGLSLASVPRLVAGSEPAGRLRRELAARWGMRVPPVFAGGAGDNAAGAVALGAIRPGSAFVSLGTSGVVWVTTDGFRPYPAGAVHAFCHTLPGVWHQMGVTLSAAASLAWWARITGQSEADLLSELGNAVVRPSEATFLPYLSGERTPHNDGAMRGVFADLSHAASRATLTQAVIEGVAFSIRDCVRALAKSGTHITTADVIGGGARSGTWVAILSSVLAIPLNCVAEAEHGAAVGAGRLARLAVTGESPDIVCRARPIIETVVPDPALVEAYRSRFARYRELSSAARPA
jgi:xylulokinase